MATSRGLDQFGRRMLRIASRFGGHVEAGVKRTAAAVDRTAVLATPVDTGRARSGWVPSLDAPLEQEREPTDAGSTLAEIKAAIDKYRLENKGVFLANIVPYITALENGHSAQAPSGMTKLALQAGIEEAKRAFRGSVSGD